MQVHAKTQPLKQTQFSGCACAWPGRGLEAWQRWFRHCSQRRCLHDIINLNNSSDDNIKNSSNSFNFLKTAVTGFLVAVNSSGDSNPFTTEHHSHRVLIHKYKYKHNSRNSNHRLSINAGFRVALRATKHPPHPIQDHCTRHAYACEWSVQVERGYRRRWVKFVAAVPRSCHARNSRRQLRHREYWQE